MRTLLQKAILSARRWSESRGRPIDSGEALAVIADHFEAACRQRCGKLPSKVRREVLGRNRGQCSVPGCSLPGRHVHHIQYRSHGGADAPWNETLLCMPHHLRGIHHGHLTVEGRAGERLVWRFGDGEIWVTEGDDDVRRGDSVSERAPPAYAA
ncbi:MAG: HNH endonuclease [Planctomycetota bacterium]